MVIGVLCSLMGCQAPVQPPIDLRVNELVAPVGLDAPQPRLGWRWEEGTPLRQTAYQLLVASEPDLLVPGKADYWDSGQVPSAQSQQIEYGGLALPPAKKVYWQVRSWDQAGQASAWSAPASWTTGFWTESQWQGHWISVASPPDSTAAFRLRRSLWLDEVPASAQVFFTGLGYGELFINGRKVGDRVMDPVFSDYEETVYYHGAEVAEWLQPGENVLGVL
ncbi:MAG: alpha-rhamnosidase, partial [Bacteroidetes bacterium]